MRDPQEERHADDAEDEEPVPYERCGVLVRRQLNQAFQEPSDGWERVGELFSDQADREQGHQGGEGRGKDALGQPK
ncbi:hypothetical protein ACFVT2_36025 [Streptomyces sp. NPDC058000]|uniref:hypothetical protein n=1 Tax=Streptomyces sp. NPDC058000 TaxID=3346299 RepID=UPI0036E941F5